MRAAQKGHVQTVQVLLDSAATVNLVQKEGWTALLLATRERHGDVVEALLAKGANHDVKVNGREPIHFAAEVGCHRCLNALLLAGAGANDRSKDDWTPLLLAAHSGSGRAITVLLANRETRKTGVTASRR